MRFAAAVVIGFLVSAAAVAAELQLVGSPARDALVEVVSDTPGKWLILGPGPPIEPGGLELNSPRHHVTADGLRCLWAGAPGTYAVLLAPEAADEPIAWLPVVIPGVPDPDLPDPDPDDPPDPDNPPDDEWGIGRKVAGWVAEITEHRDLAAGLARAYTATADRLDAGEDLDIGNAMERLLADLAAVLNSTQKLAAWSDLRGKVKTDLRARELDRHQLAEYYRAVAAGLGAANAAAR